jgi:hypothetical protein
VADLGNRVVSVRRHRWLVLPAVVTVLMAVGGFFAVQSRSAADQYASIGSFFLALLAAAWSIATWVRARPGPAWPNGGSPSRPGPEGGTPNAAAAPGGSRTGGPSVVVIGDGTGVQTGKRSRMKIKNTYRPGT